MKPVTAAKVEEALRKALGNLGLLKSSEETRELVKEELIRAGEAAKENWDAAGMPISIEDIRGCMILVCSVPVQNLRIREFLNHSTGLKKYGVFYSVYPQMQMVMCLAAVNSHKAVSYTHLDVYKRQVLNECRRKIFKRCVQTIVYLPNFLSWVIVAVMLGNMFGPNGFINSILGMFGHEPILFLASNTLSLIHIL